MNLCSKDLCTGCMSCEQSCPISAISKTVVEGFVYPIIDSSKCIECGVCVKSCPVLNVDGLIGNTHDIEDTCIAAWNKNKEIRLKSSSGGVFSCIAQWIIENDGVVYGASFDNELNVRHVRVDAVEGLDKLRRSKYVQSDINNTYKEVRSFLDKGYMVLYSGTPCQIAGLKRFLRKDYASSLFTVDVLCQGVPSQLLFNKYISEIEKQKGDVLVDANFRLKNRGWRTGLMHMSLTGRKRIYWRALNCNEFYRSFYNELFMRPSCYNCRFKICDLGYYSDLTLADFWRIGHKERFDVNDYEKGISAILLNTPNGKRLFEGISNKIEYRFRTWKEFSSNGGLNRSKLKEINKEAFEHLELNSWTENQRKYYPMTKKEFIGQLIWLLLGERVIRKIKKIRGVIP